MIFALIALFISLLHKTLLIVQGLGTVVVIY